MNTVRTETLCSSYIELASENRKASVRIKGTIKIADCIQFDSMRLVWKITLHRSDNRSGNHAIIAKKPVYFALSYPF